MNARDTQLGIHEACKLGACAVPNSAHMRSAQLGTHSAPIGHMRSFSVHALEYLSVCGSQLASPSKFHSMCGYHSTLSGRSHFMHRDPTPHARHARMLLHMHGSYFARAAHVDGVLRPYARDCVPMPSCGTTSAHQYAELPPHIHHFLHVVCFVLSPV